MNTKFLVSVIVCIELIVYSKAQEVFQIKSRDRDKAIYSAPDSNGVRHPLKSPSYPVSLSSSSQNLPYPILFIHGLNSSAATWDVFTNYLDSVYGLNFGGRIDVCLNADGDNSTANLNFYPTSSADIAFFSGVNDIVIGDYYYLNFHVGKNGSVYPPSYASDYVLSNQSAIYKQGMAVKKAIEFILQKTGRKEIVLMGHSMGGLASRQYLQNPFLWQNILDIVNGHKVAKLVTTGTPHGGSNASGGILTAIFTDIDEYSEAVRDLRRTYFYSGDSCVFLFGGYEDSVVMDDHLFGSFYNYDVNCNGQIYEYVPGLNDKPLPLTLDYSCIIGDCWGCFFRTEMGLFLCIALIWEISTVFRT